MISAIRTILGLGLLFELTAAAVEWERDFDFTWLGLAATLGFIWFLLEKFEAPAWIWVLAFSALLLDALSALFLLYTQIPFWDFLMHALGGATITAGALEQILRRWRMSMKFTTAAIYLTVATVGFCYEFLEYLVDRFYFGYPRTLVSAYNTIEDQLFNLVGATLALSAYFAWTYWRGRTRMLVPSIAHASTEERKR